MVVSVDGLLERLGFRYQCLVLMVLSSWLTQVSLHHQLHHHYLTTPLHRCKLPEGWAEVDSLPAVLVSRPSTYSRDPKRSQEYPRAGYSRCLMYKDPKIHRRGTQSCIFGYVFTLQHEEWSVVAEWGLVCGRSWIKDWVVTSYLIGLVVGGLLFGFLADRFGRRNLLVVSVTSVSCIGLALHFVRRLVVFLGLRFLQAVFVQGIYVTAWTLLGELLPPRWRCRALVAGSMTRPLGVALGTAAALTVQHWRGLHLTAALPLLISLLYYWMVPESLRWLLTRGKLRRARQVAAQLARHNLITLPPTAHDQMDHLAAHVYLDLPWESLVTLFKTPRLRTHILVTVYMWLAVSLADSGFRKELRETTAGGEYVKGLEEWPLTLLGGRGHLGAALGAGVEAGAVVLSAVLTTLLYRRAFLVVTLVLSAALALAVTCVLQLMDEAWLDVTALATALRFVGVLTVGCARTGMGVVVVEVTPTTSRASAVGLCAAHAALGEIIANLMTAVAKMTYPSVSWLTSAGACLLAAILALMLPETSGTTLPDVVDEAEVVGLAYTGNIIKSCYAGYARSPYWTELDREANGGTLQGRSECNDICRSFSKKSGPSLISTTEEHIEQGSRESDGQPHSPASQAPSDSPSSLMSLVDVSRVNGNNSDTSDSNDQDIAAIMSRKSPNSETKTAKTAEGSDMKGIIMHYSKLQRPLPKIPDETNSHPPEQINEASDSSDQNKNKEVSLGAMALYNEAEENDFSLSVFSLKFRHIKRPVSPTERRICADLHYSSSCSSTCTSRPRKTLIQECISQNSFHGDGSHSCNSSQSERDTEVRNIYARVTPIPSILKDSHKGDRPTEQFTEVRKSFGIKPGNIQETFQSLYLCNTHQTNSSLPQTGAILPSKNSYSAGEQSSSSVSPIPLPEAKPKRRRSMPVIRVSTATPHSRKEKTSCSAPPSRYLLVKVPGASSTNTTDHSSPSKAHTTKGSLPAREASAKHRRREASEPEFMAAISEWEAGTKERDEKVTISRRISQALSTKTDSKSRTAEVDTTGTVDVNKNRQRTPLTPSPPHTTQKEGDDNSMRLLGHSKGEP